MGNILTNGFSSLYNSWFGSKRFFDNKVPLPRENQLIGSKSIVKLDTNDYEDIVTQVSELGLVIGTEASFVASGVWKHLDKDGVEIEDSEFVKRFNEPNYYQGGTDFLRDCSISMSTHGNGFLKYERSARSLSKPTPPLSIFVLPFKSLEVETTDKAYYEVSNVSDVISKVIDTSVQPYNEFTAEDLILLRDNTTSNKVNNMLSVSRIDGIRVPLSNIKVAYDSRNVGMQEKGALAVLSPAEAKGITSYKPSEKEELERSFTSDYGIKKGQKRIMWANAPLNMLDLSYDMSKLQLLEEVRADFNVVVDHYGLVRDIFSTEKGSTFENKKTAYITTFENTIIPKANIISEAFTKAFAPDGTKFILDYSHLAFFKEDEKIKAESDRSIVELVLSVNEAITEGMMTRQNGIELLVFVHQFEEATAELLVTDIERNEEDTAGEVDNAGEETETI